jgi:hypothetical protein
MPSSSMQCAAVSTTSAAMSEPPQKCPYAVCSDTMKG